MGMGMDLGMTCLRRCAILHAFLTAALALRDSQSQTDLEVDVDVDVDLDGHAAAAAVVDVDVDGHAAATVVNVNDTQDRHGHGYSYGYGPGFRRGHHHGNGHGHSSGSNSNSNKHAVVDKDTFQGCGELSFKSVTEYYSSNEKSYTLRLLNPCKQNMVDGTWVKGFRERQERDDFLALLKRLSFSTDCDKAYTFTGKCVHVDASAECCKGWSESDKCYFVVTEYGQCGWKTLKNCLSYWQSENDPGKWSSLITRALEAAYRLHAEGWYHGNYQLSSLTSDSRCAKSGVVITDLEDVKRSKPLKRSRGSITREAEAKAEAQGTRAMFEDYARLLGVCNLGGRGMTSYAWTSEIKSVAGRIDAVAKDLLNCSSSEQLTRQEVKNIGRKLYQAVEDIN